MRFTRAAAVASLLTVSGCVHPIPSSFDRSRIAALSCRQILPEGTAPPTWLATSDLEDAFRLSRWCETVGPVFLRPRPASVSGAPIDRLAIVSWNIHEGDGDVDDLVRRLRRGEFTDDEPVEQFVLLLQEAIRRDPAVPLRIPHGYPAPRSITPRHGSRDAGIRRFADEGLAVLYAPSMRNGRQGREGGAEDRGNAILSTLPLLEPRIVELPLERQRRVAAAAAVEGRTSGGAAWRLHLVNVHLDTALALGHGGPSAARRRQVTALLDALRVSARPDGNQEAMALGGDFNTWSGGHEAAVGLLNGAFPDTPAADRGPTWRGPIGLHATLDHIFVRGPVSASRVRRLSSRFGSDHFPLLTVIRF